jgi:hypothetical protein
MGFSWNSIHKLFTKSYHAKVSLVQTESVLAILYLRACMNFNLYLSHISTAFSTVRYRILPCNATQPLWVLWNSVEWKPHVILGSRQTFSCTFHIFHPIWIKFGSGLSTKMYQSWVQNGAVSTTLYSGGINKFTSVISNLFVLDKVRHKQYAHNFDEHFQQTAKTVHSFMCTAVTAMAWKM